MKSKLVLITGASRGIGHAILKHCLSEGYTVAATATSQSGVDQIQSTINQLGDGKAYQLNLTQDETITTTMGDIQSDFEQPILCLINNAGVTSDNLMLRMSVDQWSQVIDTNLTGSFKISKAVLKGMLKARWGRIVNISSIVSSIGNPGQVNYAASKAGIEAMTRCLTAEVAARNITVNCILPGYISSDMTEKINEQHKQLILDKIPMKRMGTADEIAQMVLFLLSESTNYMTGQKLIIDGGMYMS